MMSADLLHKKTGAETPKLQTARISKLSGRLKSAEHDCELPRKIAAPADAMAS